MSSLRVIHERPVWARILAHADSISIARIVRSAPPIQDVVLSVLPAVLSERSPRMPCLAASHFREMYYDAPFGHEVRVIHDHAELTVFHDFLARTRCRILGFFHRTYNSQDISCIGHAINAIDRKASFAKVILADDQCQIYDSVVSADMLKVVLQDGQQDVSQRPAWLLGFRVLGVQEGRHANCWQAWSNGLWHIWDVNKLETLPLPFLVVFGCDYGATVAVDDYVNIWSTAEAKQQFALRSMSGKSVHFSHAADESTSNGVLVRVLSLLRTHSLRRDVLTFLDSMRPDHHDYSSHDRIVAASIHECAPLLLDCLRSHDTKIRHLTLQVLLMFKVRWLADLTADVNAVSPLFDTTLHQFWQESSSGDKNQTDHPSRIAINVLANLCIRVSGEKGEETMSAEWINARRATSLVAAIVGELQEVIGASTFQEQCFTERVGDELFDLLDGLLSTSDGIAAIASTPTLISLLLGAVVVRCRFLDSIARPGDYYRQREGAYLVGRFRKLIGPCRESVLQAGALDVFYHYLAQTWHSLVAPAVEDLLSSLAVMPGYIGAAFALRQFSPDPNSGFLPIACGDQVDVVATQGVWSYGTSGDSGGWFPACFVWPLSVARAGMGGENQSNM